MTVDRLPVAPAALASAVHDWLRANHTRRFGHLTARTDGDDRTVVEALLLDPSTGSATVFSAPLTPGELEYPSVTRHVAAAHRAERALGDMFGIHPTGHPRWKSVILHDDAWPLDFAPLATTPGLPRDPNSFLKVAGEGIHEIPVGPIHAGIIEPGHFRFSCAGEVIVYLETRFGYQHRGVEKRLAEQPWQRARYLAESAASDTPVGNALAHALAIEQLLGLSVPPRAAALRSMSLEVERLANHIGDLGALCGDIGYSAGSSLFAPLRASALALGTLLAGGRFQRYYVRPGGISRPLPEGDLVGALAKIEKRLRELVPLVLENPAAVERMEGAGHLSAAQAREFGIVGPAARASGIAYDVREAFGTSEAPPSSIRQSGDALARAQIRADEAFASLELIARLSGDLPAGPVFEPCDHLSLPADAVGVGIVEAWRGELIHWMTTGSDGRISRYSIKDPSLNNWTGLALAARGNLVADFPLCNKSFNLSYSGNDL